MPDINPAELSRPSISLSTPILSNKSITVSTPSAIKASRPSQSIPARIDLEPIYTALKAAIGAEQWATYKEATTQFLIGRLNQVEFTDRVDSIITSPTGEKEHLHNTLIAAIYGNVTREIPDQGLAPWVSANDKPATATGTKPISGDAAERRLKGDVMQLPSRDRRRIKDIAQNDYDPFDALANIFTDHHKVKAPRPAGEVPPSAGGLNRMNFDLEIKKKYDKPLAAESGEFPDISNIEARMLPHCYEAGLASGHVPDAAQLMSVATESFVKEVLSSMFSRTRSNGPGDSASAGFGATSSWVQTHKYKRQLAREEEAAMRGEVTRDKGGLLPIESRAAGERGPLGMADLRVALEIGDCGLSQFPIITKLILNTYREGELEHMNDHTWLDGREKGDAKGKDRDILTTSINGLPLTNGIRHEDPMDIDDDNGFGWTGGRHEDVDLLDNALETVLAGGL